MPAMARLPSGSLVEVLCGQPEQKNGVRAIVIGALAGGGLVEGFQPRQALLQQRALMAEPAQPRDQRRSYDGRIEFAFARQESRAVFVALADHGRPVPGVDIVEDAHQLVFDEAALLLDDEHVLQAFGEALGALLFQRPGQRDFVDAKPSASASRSLIPKSAIACLRSR